MWLVAADHLKRDEGVGIDAASTTQATERGGRPRRGEALEALEASAFPVVEITVEIVVVDDVKVSVEVAVLRGVQVHEKVTTSFAERHVVPIPVRGHRDHEV